MFECIFNMVSKAEHNRVCKINSAASKSNSNLSFFLEQFLEGANPVWINLHLEADFLWPKLASSNQSYNYICNRVVGSYKFDSHLTGIFIDYFKYFFFRGEDNDVKPAFRKWFSFICELRSVCPTPSVVALSAKCTLKIRERR